MTPKKKNIPTTTLAEVFCSCGRRFSGSFSVGIHPESRCRLCLPSKEEPLGHVPNVLIVR
jgi:hypothetical protein